MVEEILHGSYDVGKNTLLPYLLARGVRSLDYVMVSHFDFDHVGGFLYIMKEIKLKNILVATVGQEESENYSKFIKIAREKRINVLKVEAGKRINIENKLFFDILWPFQDKTISENAINNNSIVCKLCYGEFKMLFTGDIEEEAERVLCGLYSTNAVLNSTVLKVAHHGSKTSTIQDFLNFINPNIALIGVGKNNTFGHPGDEVIERLQNMRNTNL